MPSRDIFKILRYVLGILTISLGVLIFAGVMLKDPVPAQFRYTLATVLVLMGIYRLATTMMRSSRSKDV